MTPTDGISLTAPNDAGYGGPLDGFTFAPVFAVALSLNWLLRIDTEPIVSPRVGVEPLPARI